jgi:hypothetical protein
VKDSGHSERGADWLSFGAEVVPLRDSFTQEVERERTKRLHLIEVSKWRQGDLTLGIALVGVVLFLLLTRYSQTG